MTEKTPNQLLSAFNYLREQATDAHRAGDGMRVLHLCTIALSRFSRRHQELEEHSVSLADLRWAFFLGLYWVLDDGFLYRLESALKNVTANEAGESDLLLIRQIHAKVQIPVNSIDLEALQSIPAKYFEARAESVEDITTILFVIELVWYEDPLQSQWSDLLELWQEKTPESSLLHKELSRLHSRLAAQSCFTSGSPSEYERYLNKNDWPREQQWLMKGWQLYFDSKYPELDELLKKIAPLIKIEGPSYIPFFTLYHGSRIQRESIEDQFLSLSRRNLVISQQPAEVFREIRTEKFSEAYSKIAQSGFQDNIATERYTCFRSALLNQLQALRNWDIGKWLTGEQQRSRICLELGAKGDMYFATRGIVYGVRSSIIANAGKHQHLDRCVQLFDGLSENDRVQIVKECLSAPRSSWLAAQTLFERLTDSIPSSMLVDVAARSVDLELHPVYSKWAITRLEFWGEIIYWAPNASQLVSILMPALNQKSKVPACWQLIHDTLIGSIVKGSREDSQQLLENIMQVECAGDNRGQGPHRFSIVYNVLMQDSRFQDECQRWLQEYIEENPSNEFHNYLLKTWDSESEEEKDDPELRKWIRDGLSSYCDKILQETTSLSIGPSQSYHGMIRKITWPRSEKQLVEKLIELIDAEHVPYVNKHEPLASMASLCKWASNSLTKTILSALGNWLEHGISGKDYSMGGPLSTGQIKGMNKEALYPALFLLIDSLVEYQPSVCAQKLSLWVMSDALRDEYKQTGEIIRICLNLSIHYQRTDEGLAIAFVGIAQAAALRGMVNEPERVLGSIRSVIFNKNKPEKLDSWLSSKSGQLFLAMEQNHLVKAATLANPIAREEAALAIRAWHESSLDFPASLVEVERRLRSDSRLRVQNVFLRD